jgi:hypothetical protein
LMKSAPCERTSSAAMGGNSRVLLRPEKTTLSSKAVRVPMSSWARKSPPKSRAFGQARYHTRCATRGPLPPFCIAPPCIRQPKPHRIVGTPENSTDAGERRPGLRVSRAHLLDSGQGAHNPEGWASYCCLATRA